MRYEVEILSQQRFETNAFDWPAAMNQRHFQSAIHDHLAIGLANTFRQVQEDAGMAFTGLDQEVCGQGRGAAERNQPDRYAPDKRFARGLHGSLGKIHLPEDRLSVLINGTTRLGHRDTLLAAQQELLLEMIFESGELLAQCGLGDMQDIGCASNAACVDDHDEWHETPCVHGIPFLLQQVECRKPN